MSRGHHEDSDKSRPEHHAADASGGESAPLLLRAAVRTWSRRDRRDSGAAVLAVAQDLIDAGSSPAREAGGLVRSGLVLRARGTRRDLAAAPWRRAAAPTVITALWLSTLLIATDVVGWRELWSNRADAYGMPLTSGGRGVLDFLDVNALKFAVFGTAAAAAATLAGRRWVAALFVAAAAACVFQSSRLGAGLSFAEFSFGHPTARDNWGEAWFSAPTATLAITNLVLLLLAMALLPGVAHAIVERGRRSRAAVPEAGATRPATGPDRATRRRTIVVATLAAALLVIGPTLLPLLTDAVLFLGRPAAQTSEASSSMVAAPILLLWIAGAVALLVAAAAARRAPAAALVALAILVALWVPLIWTLLPFGIDAYVPFSHLAFAAGLGVVLQISLFWLIHAALLVAIGTGVAAAAGRAERRRLAGAPGGATETVDRPTRGAVA